MIALGRFFLALMATLAIVVPAGAAETTGKVMIVLDASGSMWGRIGGKPKIDIARATIRDLLKSWDPKIELGLVVYGHRHKGRCDDIETLIPVGKVNRKAIMKSVNGLQPKGKTPLSDAVRHAAEALKYTEERATVILVSDGKETCKADPCALGKSLKAKGIDFTAHVVGFDIKKGEEAGLKCLAANTGGKFIAAKDARSLNKALKTTVTEVKKAVVVKPKPKPAAKDAGTKLVARYAAGGKEYAGQLNWWVFDPKKDLAGKRKQIAHQHRGKSGHIFRDLKPGRYVVVGVLSDHRHIKREFELEIKAGEARTNEFVFDIGTVRFDAKLAPAGPAFKGDLGWKVLAPKAGLDGKRKQLANFWRQKSGGVFILPAGDWHIDAVLPDARHVTTSGEITVKAGGEEAHEFVFNAGTVRFDAYLVKGGPAFKSDLGWKVLAAKAGLDGKRRQVANFWRNKTGSIYILPAGEWRIEGVLPDYRHVTLIGNIGVKPGGEEAHAFVFNAGAVRVDVTKNGKPPDRQVAYTVWGAKQGLDGKRKKIANYWRVKPSTVTLLPAGDYVITGTDPDARKHVGETRVSVEAGGEAAIKLDLRQP